MTVNYDTNPDFKNPLSIRRNSNSVVNSGFEANKTTDFTGHVKLENLKPDTVYYYKVQFSDPKNISIVSPYSLPGSFRTSPDNNVSKPLISFVVGVDLGGQNYCKRAELSGGYPIFGVIKALSPTFFVFNGNQIYADYTCNVNGPVNVTGWHNVPGNYSSITDDIVNWNDHNQIQQVFNSH